MDIARVGQATNLPQRYPASLKAGSPLTVRPCQVCDQGFWAPKKGQQTKTCSASCHQVLRKRTKTAVPVPCVVCGAVRMIAPSFIVAAGNTCSNTCRLQRLNARQRTPMALGLRGRHVSAKGYVRIHLGPGRGHHLEHRIVASYMLGRALTAVERVHHLDGDRTNNLPLNLVVCASQSEHLIAWHQGAGGQPSVASQKEMARRAAHAVYYHELAIEVAAMNIEDLPI